MDSDSKDVAPSANPPAASGDSPKVEKKPAKSKPSAKAAKASAPSATAKNNNKDLSGFQIETWFNLLLQRLFPVWYCIRFITESPMEYIGEINPKSHLAKKWLSVTKVCKSASESLVKGGPDWADCADLLSKIPRSRSLRRYISIRNLLAVEHCQDEGEYPTLLEYAERNSTDIPNSHAEHFEQLAHIAFPDEHKAYNVEYHEIDGRYFIFNETEPVELGALLLQCRDRQRDLNIKADIDIEFVDMRAVEIMRSRYWLLIMKRDTAYQLAYLIRSCDIPCQIAEFERRRSDLVFLIIKKNNARAVRIVEALVRTHLPRSVVEWGRYLSKHQYPYRNR